MNKNINKIFIGFLICIACYSALFTVGITILACNGDAPVEKERQEPDRVYTDDGYRTSCQRKTVNGKEYFYCHTYGYDILTPVVK